jgi:hypothetical protein
MPHVSFEIKENDTSPALEGILRDGFGSPINITAATIVINMRLQPGGAVKINGGSMSVVGSAVNGRVRYAWSASDTDTPGIYEAEIQITFAGGAVRTIPPKGYFIVDVTDDIG